MSTILVSKPIRLGREDKTVEVDETKFGHKRKFIRGRHEVEHPCIFSISF